MRENGTGPVMNENGTWGTSLLPMVVLTDEAIEVMSDEQAGDLEIELSDRDIKRFEAELERVRQEEMEYPTGCMDKQLLEGKGALEVTLGRRAGIDWDSFLVMLDYQHRLNKGMIMIKCTDDRARTSYLWDCWFRVREEMIRTILVDKPMWARYFQTFPMASREIDKDTGKRPYLTLEELQLLNPEIEEYLDSELEKVEINKNCTWGDTEECDNMSSLLVDPPVAQPVDPGLVIGSTLLPVVMQRRLDSEYELHQEEEGWYRAPESTGPSGEFYKVGAWLAPRLQYKAICKSVTRIVALAEDKIAVRRYYDPTKDEYAKAAKMKNDYQGWRYQQDRFDAVRGITRDQYDHYVSNYECLPHRACINRLTIDRQNNKRAEGFMALMKEDSVRYAVTRQPDRTDVAMQVLDDFWSRRAGQVDVVGYTKRDGTTVSPYYRLYPLRIVDTVSSTQEAPSVVVEE